MLNLLASVDHCRTVLNSWGTGWEPDQLRLKGGVTGDGMFKVNMGLLGELSGAHCLQSP